MKIHYSKYPTSLCYTSVHSELLPLITFHDKYTYLILIDK